jgi:segregation and condensation protein A
MSEEAVFQVTLSDFSGPLDLLCHLVETSAIDASSLKLSEVLSQYVAFLVSSRRATLSELAEFFSLASRLLIRKVRSLLPRAADTGEETAETENGGAEDENGEEFAEEKLAALLERFKPYRSAAIRLGELKASRERSFARVSDEGGPPWFDIGDLFGLSTLWWNLIDEYSRSRASSSRDGFMADIPDAVPEEVLVERRMDEVIGILSERGAVTLSLLLGGFGRGGLIVTLLALLELSRLGRLRIRQAGEWEDLEIETR